LSAEVGRRIMLPGLMREAAMLMDLTHMQVRYPEVDSIVERLPPLSLNEIAVVQIKYRGRDIMVMDEYGRLRWGKVAELQAYVAACRDAFERGEALLNSLQT
jgi:hypothetical protein